MSAPKIPRPPGYRSGRLTVTDAPPIEGKILVRCDCGNEKRLFPWRLRDTTSCGCKRGNSAYVLGQRQGALVVTSHRDVLGKIGVRCDCGTEKRIYARMLKVAVSCGCTRSSAMKRAWESGLMNASRTVARLPPVPYQGPPTVVTFIGRLVMLVHGHGLWDGSAIALSELAVMLDTDAAVLEDSADRLEPWLHLRSVAGVTMAVASPNMLTLACNSATRRGLGERAAA